MAVVSCDVALGEFRSSPLPGLDSEYEIPYNIITNAQTDNGATIMASGCLHPRFTPFPDMMFATLRGISCHRDPKSPWWNAVWRAVERYSSVPLTEKEEQQNLSPLDRPAEIDWVQVPYQVPVLCGWKYQSNGLIPPTFTQVMVPIVNSAYDLPDPVPEVTEYYWVANVSKNVPITPPSWILQDYNGAINSTTYQIEALTVLPECSRMIDLRLSKKLKENDVRYRTLQFSLEFRGRRDQRTDENGYPLVVTSTASGYDEPPPPFNLELPDIGLHKWNPATSTRTKFFTDDTPPRPVSQPILMNGAGDKLTDPSPFNMVLGNWRILKTKDFNVLPLT